MKIIIDLDSGFEEGYAIVKAIEGVLGLVSVQSVAYIDPLSLSPEEIH